ncbi:MAG: Trigger factor [Verrucomicrobia subdivision 3 bacterium]|nr:Trigger factor [Limisphaerales bacterium]MCS1413865.1 Trigger factor [Limisphaerales bacterium]
MNVSVESLAPCKKLIRVDFPAEEVGKTFDRITREFQKHANLPGFRPGKAPKHLVVRSYGDRIEQEVKSTLIGNGYRQAVKDNDLHIVGHPDFEEIQFAKDTPFQFAVTIETAPDFELPEYKGLKAKREMRTVTESDVDEALKVLLDKRSSFKDVDRAVADGDFVVIDYKGICEGKPITKVAPSAERLESSKEFWVNIGENQFIPGFTEQLVGAKKGEDRSVNIDFAADFAVKELAGKAGVFEVTIKEVKEQVLSELNDEFAQQYGAETVEALREGVERDLEAELKSKVNRDVRKQLMQALMSQVTCELPESVVHQETKNVVYNIVRENRDRGVSREVIDNQKDKIYSMATDSAKDHIKSAFIIGKIAAVENISATNEEINHRITELAQTYNIKPEKMAKQLKERNGISEIQEQIISSKVLDLLELHAEIEDVLPSD